jgi:hypothetical protein
MEQDERFNALCESFYYVQIIDEACNGDLGWNNHFRRSLTLEDCVHANGVAKVWKKYAENYVGECNVDCGCPGSCRRADDNNYRDGWM